MAQSNLWSKFENRTEWPQINLKSLHDLLIDTRGGKIGDFGKLLPGKFSKFWEIFENFLIKMYDPGKSETVNW